MLGFCIKERTLRLPLPRTAGCSPLFPRAAGGGGGWVQLALLSQTLHQEMGTGMTQN